MRTPGGASGADVHAWIVAHRPELKNKMLFITGDTVNPETMKALNETGVPYIEKPFRVNDLMTVVEKIFGR
jgi:FixJ family two-component response regulator